MNFNELKEVFEEISPGGEMIFIAESTFTFFVSIYNFWSNGNDSWFVWYS